jgi:RNA-directed DNA polymerase
VPTPLNGNPKTMIEDCFDASVKNTKVDGKSFNPSSDALDGKTEYGKYVFAQQVVKKNQGNINFQGFKPLLERIDAVLIRHNNINIVSGALHAPS